MMSILTKGARLIMFGSDMSKKKPTLGSVGKTIALNTGRRIIGLPAQSGHSLGDLCLHWLESAFAALVGGRASGTQLPADLPLKLFSTIDDTLRNRGGLADKEHNLPNFWLEFKSALSTPFFWSLTVEYAPSADPSKVASFEMALEDAITRAGYDYNIRIQKRPLRIEIDKPTPPTVTLAELWPQVAAMAQNERTAVLGMAYTGGRTTTLATNLTGEDFSAFIAASSGGGKTQLAMSMLLSLAMTNSPANLTMVLVDPKAVDFRPFNALPHLALPVVNEPTYAAEVVQWLCDEMDARTRRAAKGDNSFFAHSILLYVDELADLIVSLPDNQAATLTTNLQRLGQKGRGVGFIIVAATQRVFDVPASAHTKLNTRFVGKMRTAGDSVAASGQAGTTTNKLPGRGSFELYCSDQQGLRIQAPFVAASDKPGYEKALKPFFKAITDRWQDATPGWMPPQPIVDDVQPAESPTLGPEQPPGPAIDHALVEALKAEYTDDPEGFSQRTVRRVYSYLNSGKRMNTVKEKTVYEQFLMMYATESAGGF
jgi:S-DNA-T family DNA segregation ATPase FtsK/SpoIIIE